MPRWRVIPSRRRSSFRHIITVKMSSDSCVRVARETKSRRKASITWVMMRVDIRFGGKWDFSSLAGVPHYYFLIKKASDLEQYRSSKCCWLRNLQYLAIDRPLETWSKCMINIVLIIVILLHGISCNIINLIIRHFKFLHIYWNHGHLPFYSIVAPNTDLIKHHLHILLQTNREQQSVYKTVNDSN